MNSYHSLSLSQLVAEPDSLSWTAHDTHGRYGSRIHVLFQCPSSGQQVALVQSKPGAYAAAHQHEGHETILVLEGSFEDQYGVHRKGELVHYPPGSQHSWHSDEGGMMYVVWGGRVKDMQQP